ncbi:FlgO family outer membrane protein [Desulfopila sp. IMCC35008]|uniref:FlgO family outer membrane protein n=1 Tax=Desulfopila sp. IMCC35008 TaxID=2653858 RepID=UPI0013D83035|nr:FlgO family outer membrane protein [Desulfopila sp. IMCC35008]
MNRLQQFLKSRFFQYGQLLVIFLSLSACSSFNCTRFEQYLGNETDLITFAYGIAEDLTADAFPPLIPQQSNMPILVTTFVDNNDLEKTSKFGRIVQEHINSRLVQIGYSVKELKLTGNLLIEEGAGESILSRDLKKLKGAANVQAILVGTYSYTNRTMYVSTRFINPVSQTIISSQDYQLCMDDAMLAMFGLQRARQGDMIEEPKQPRLNSLLY